LTADLNYGGKIPFLGAYSYTKPGAEPKDYENLSKPINKLFLLANTQFLINQQLLMVHYYQV
tara:strand:+ start:142 stop:327 length:186 start_codon:yes stop_codon:yes gene_type:complete